MAEKKGGSGLDLKIVGIAGSALLTAGVVGWFASNTETGDTVKDLSPRLVAVEATIAKHDKWIAEWPQTGELSADVRQNTQIAYLKAELSQLEENVQLVRERVRELEVKAARLEK